MKGIKTGYFLFGFLLLFALTACSKQPVQEINAAKTAVDSAMAEGAEKYSPAEAKKVNDALTEAMAEVKAQDGKFIKDYKKAGEMLAKVKTNADSLKAGLAAKKEEARKKAIAAEESANAAVSEAKASLARSMKSSRANPDMEALSNSIKRLDDAIAEIRKLIATEDYTTAIEKAGGIKKEADDMIRNAGDDAEKASAGTAAKKKK